MNVRELEPFGPLANDPNASDCRFLSVNHWLTVIVSKEYGLWHLSVSHPRRYPTWDEMRDCRYAFLPSEITVALLLPPPDQYVNLHRNCFHLHEVPQMHEQSNLSPILNQNILDRILNK